MDRVLNYVLGEVESQWALGPATLLQAHKYTVHVFWTFEYQDILFLEDGRLGRSEWSGTPASSHRVSKATEIDLVVARLKAKASDCDRNNFPEQICLLQKYFNKCQILQQTLSN